MAKSKPKQDKGAAGGRNPSPDDTRDEFESLSEPDSCEINGYIDGLVRADWGEMPDYEEYRPTNGADLGLISDIMDKHGPTD